MEIVMVIKSIVYSILLALIILYKKIKQMKKIIKWVKNLFTSKKQVNNNESNSTKIKTTAIKNPDGTPTRGPK